MLKIQSQDIRHSKKQFRKDERIDQQQAVIRVSFCTMGSGDLDHATTSFPGGGGREGDGLTRVPLCRS